MVRSPQKMHLPVFEETEEDWPSRKEELATGLRDLFLSDGTFPDCFKSERTRERTFLAMCLASRSFQIPSEN
jgi:hypothetical protein